MKKIADISIFNDFSDLLGSESTGQGESSAPEIGSNFEYNALRQARNIQAQCNELMQQLDGIQEGRMKYRKNLQGRFLKAIDDLDEKIYRLSQRAPENTPVLRGAFYDVAHAHDSLIHKYHMIYDNFSYKNYTPYMSRDAYVNRPISAPAAGPQYGPGNVDGPIPFGGLMSGNVGDSLGALANLPRTPETALASSAAASLIRIHQNFKNWYNNVMAFEEKMDHLQRQNIPPSPKCKDFQNFVLSKLNLPEDSAPQSDMLELLAGSN